MITIYCDFHRVKRVKADSYTSVVSNVQDYIPLRQRLRRTLDDKDDNYTVIVQSPILALWLKDLRAYGSQVVDWVEADLREYFLRKFGFSPPAVLDDSVIKDLLLDPPIVGDRTTADPIGWILNQRIDPIWGHAKTYENHLADLAVWSMNGNQVPQQFKPLLEARLAQWMGSDERYRIFFECSWKEAGELILLRWALRSYPISSGLFKQVAIVPLEDCGHQTSACIDLLKRHNTVLRQFWSSWAASNSPQNLMSALQWMSGLADAELDIFEDWAQSNLHLLTYTLLDLAGERFSALTRSHEVLERLAKLVPPPQPLIPNNEWPISRWLNWATEEYLPYFAWVIHNDQPRDTQIEFATSFADWLVYVYPNLSLDHEAPIATNQFGKIRESFDSNLADVVFWFIVDGLTWWQGRMLSAICAERDMGVTQIRPILSALPTITSISKRALVQGYLDPTNIKQPISQVLQSNLQRHFSHVHVYTQYHEFKEVLNTGQLRGIYALFYNALDHQSHEIRGFTDDESVEGHLNLVARLAKEGFQRCLSQGLRARAYISSDHGSTLLPLNCPVLEVPRFAYEIEDEDALVDTALDDSSKPIQRTRVCATAKVPESDDLKRIERDWYYLQQDAFNLPQPFFIPKGYAAVGRRPKGWTHGGATPEEAIAPFIELQPTPVALVEPLVEVEGYLMQSKPNTLLVTATNPNTIPLTIHTLTISGIPINTVLGIIKPFSQLKGEIKMMSTSNKGSSQHLEWRLICEGGGKQKQFKGYVDIPIRRLQISEVDEMFGDIL